MSPQWLSLALAILVQTATIAFVLGGALRDIRALKERESEANANRDKTIRLEEQMSTVKDDTASIKRSVEVIQRTLANIATRNLDFSGHAAE